MSYRVIEKHKNVTGLTNQAWSISHHWLLMPLGKHTDTDAQTKKIQETGLKFWSQL